MTHQKLPNVHRAVVPEAKIVDYLLNLLHSKGKSKARFFLSFGFTQRAWTIFADALREHAQTQPLVATEGDPEYGVRYVVEGRIKTPDGRHPHIRVIWFVNSDEEEQIPRLVTAYPLEENDD
ncbi:MAG: hypothetical protein JNJ61_17020 [Anaerolineae bacterium]|nr:hypothetical protein [Anaerolineae bacterium]